MGRKPCCEKVGLKKGSWTAEEDKKLINFMLATHPEHGRFCWRAVPKLAGLLRCGKSCRLRWTNYLRPDLRRGLLSESEEKLVIDLQAKLGNRWSKIASHLPGRTDNEIKNIWNTHIKKKLRKMGVDTLTRSKLVLDDRRPEKDEAAASSDDSMHLAQRLLIADDDPEARSTAPPSAAVGGGGGDDGDGCCPDFCVDEVPIVQPHEMLVIPPWQSSTSSSSSSGWDCGSASLYSFPSPSTACSLGEAGRQTDHELIPCTEMQESVCFWGLDDLIGWDSAIIHREDNNNNDNLCM